MVNKARPVAKKAPTVAKKAPTVAKKAPTVPVTAQPILKEDKLLKEIRCDPNTIGESLTT